MQDCIVLCRLIDLTASTYFMSGGTALPSTLLTCHPGKQCLVSSNLLPTCGTLCSPGAFHSLGLLNVLGHGMHISSLWVTKAKLFCEVFVVVFTLSPSRESSPCYAVNTKQRTSGLGDKCPGDRTVLSRSDSLSILMTRVTNLLLALHHRMKQNRAEPSMWRPQPAPAESWLSWSCRAVVSFIAILLRVPVAATHKHLFSFQ